jgi:predicted GNAT family acetyltransferase
MALRVESSRDADEVERVTGAYLRFRPVDHHLTLTFLADEVPATAQFWWASDGGRVQGMAWQSHRTTRANLTPVEHPAVAEALAQRMAVDQPDLPGVFGEAATAAAFAGAWADLTGRGAQPVEGQRLHELRGVRAAARPEPPGAPAVATAAELDEVVALARAFDAEVAMLPPPDLAERYARRIAAGNVHLWRHDGVASWAACTRPVAGVVRIGPVHTPVERRRQGYAEALVRAVTAQALARGAQRTALYTQLDNPTSAAIYRRIGYRPVAEMLVYRLGADTG